MVASAQLSVSRLERSFDLMSAAAVSSWQKLWPGVVDHGIDPTNVPADSLLLDEDETWDSKQDELLHGVDAYCAHSPNLLSSQLSSATCLSEGFSGPSLLGRPKMKLPVRHIAKRDLPALAADIRATCRRMLDILRQSEIESAAGVGVAVGAFFSEADCESSINRRSSYGLTTSIGREAEVLSGDVDPSSSTTVAVHQAPLINALSVSRILHGISSPLFSWTEFKPAGMGHSRLAMLYGGSGGLWGKYAEYDFCQIAFYAHRILQELSVPVCLPVRDTSG